MQDDPYTPRQHDHLVEPMYAGLGCDGDARDGEGEREAAGHVVAAPSGLWAALGRLLRSLRRARP